MLLQNLELLLIVRARLLKDKVLAVPRVHVHPSNGAHASELHRHIQALKGELVAADGENPSVQISFLEKTFVKPQG